ncbi:NAD(P)-dependent oxidoreductase [Aestuariivirga sp.]|uniref:NAD(P)-dependent oxidoreductase n=1 Tax=Aestuariivirga sp. TaxID=2650926 RepID=UPI0039E5F66D
MRYFPIFIDLDGRMVVIVGGGEEALRKVRLLSRTAARIVVVADALHPELAANPKVEWTSQPFSPVLLDGAALAVCADATLNDAVSAAAQARGIPVNAVDCADLSTFIVPSIVDRAPVVVAIGTEGTAPMLGQGLRARIDAMLPQALGSLAETAARLRGRVAKTIPAGNRRRSFWQRLFFGDVRDSYLAGDLSGFQSGVEALFRSEAAPAQGRVSFVDLGPGDPELLTIKAQRKLLEADVIVHDRFLDSARLEMARRDAVRIPASRNATAILLEEAAAGRHVVRVSQGEADVEEILSVTEAGIPVETVPGISSPARLQAAFPVRDDISDAILRAAS